MIRSFRLVKARYADSALDGEGARRLGGRWNSPGTVVIYTAGSIAVAVLEQLAHLEDTELLLSFVSIELQFEEDLVTYVDPLVLPQDWQASPPTVGTQLLGDRWVEVGSKPVMAVPSAIVPRELNFILNPAHKEFRAIKTEPPQPFVFDRRFARRR